MNTRALAELIAPACRSGGERLIRFFDEQGERQVRNPADHPLAFLLTEAIGDVPPEMADAHQISYLLDQLERDAADLNAVIRQLRRAQRQAETRAARPTSAAAGRRGGRKQPAT
jgi:hypothetical protein